MKTQFLETDTHLVVASTENIAPALQEAQDQRNRTPSWRKFDPKQTFHRVAVIPPSLIVEFKNRGCDLLRGAPEDERKMTELLNGDFAYLKSVDARL
ncbi:MAG: hypothetical protein ACYCUI_09640 [Vulcanimicrobiaceae bacterium]